jgi:hypothetical protein
MRWWIVSPDHIRNKSLLFSPCISKHDHSVELLALGLVDVHHLQAVRIVESFEDLILHQCEIERPPRVRVLAILPPHVREVRTYPLATVKGY